MNASPKLPAWVTLALALLLVGMKGEPFRYARSVSCKPGFCVLELPDDVLAAARPALSDVRLVSEGAEVGYLLEAQLSAPPKTATFVDVGSERGRETTALLDRGDNPDSIDAITLLFAGPEPFLKPLVLEASDDRVLFRKIAQASVFRVPSAQMTQVRFAPNDRRYLRLRLDDRASEPRRPVSAVLHPAALAPAPERTVAVDLSADSGDDAADRYMLRLPSANLPAVALVLEIPDPVFARAVRVYEKLVFRDQLSRRLVGEGQVMRSAAGEEQLRVPLIELTSSALEVELERAGTPISLKRAELRIRPTRLVFRAPDAGKLELLYGSPSAEAPVYDVGRALAEGLPKELASASLGKLEDRGERAELPQLVRGPVIDAQRFAAKRPITLPRTGKLAYLDLVSVSPTVASGVRIVDDRGRQVPFVLEAEPRRVAVPLKFTTSHANGKTTLRIAGISPREPLTELELRASGPAYFRRRVDVYEHTSHERGPTVRRSLGSAAWEKRQEVSEASMRVALSVAEKPEILVEIDDGDNAPLLLSGASGTLLRPRIDFLFEAGERLFLLSDDERALAPNYDLAVLEDALLRAPALPARVAPIEATLAAPSEAAARRPWFWAATALAGALVVLALVRALRRAPTP